MLAVMGRLTQAAAALGLIREEAPQRHQGPRVPAPATRTGDLGRIVGMPAVYRAVQLIQTGVSQLSLDAVRDGAPDPTPRPLLTQPDPTSDLEEVLAETVTSLSLRGNAYWLVSRALDGRPTGVRVLPPLDCIPEVDRRTGVRWTTWDGRKWTSRELVHLRTLKVAGQAAGLGPIQAAMRTLAAAVEMSDYSLMHSGVPAGILTSDQTIKPDTAEAVKKRWNETIRRDEVAVLGHGLRFAHIAMTPAEIQFIETRQLDVIDTARLFGIPPHLMQAAPEGSSLTYQNMSQADVSFLRWSLMFYFREIERAFTTLLPRGTKARFNLDAVLRADTAVRMATHATAINAGIYDANEARRIENMGAKP